MKLINWESGLNHFLLTVEARKTWYTWYSSPLLVVGLLVADQAVSAERVGTA